MERAEFIRRVGQDLSDSWHGESLRDVLQSQKDYLRPDRENNEVAIKSEKEAMFRVILIMRRLIQGMVEEEKMEPKEVMKLFRQEEKKTRIFLREVNRQLKENRHWVSIEHPEIGRLRLPVVELNLFAAEDDTPCVLIGGIATACDQSVSLSTALALAGKRIFVMSYPEQLMVESEDWVRRVRGNKTYGLHARVMKETIKALGLRKIDLIGNSMGGGIALEVARDPDFGEIENLTLFEPMGFSHKDWLEIGWAYYVKQGGRVLREAKTRVKVLFDQKQDGNRTKTGAWMAAADLLRREQFKIDCLKDVKVGGRYQVWLGGESPLLDPELVKIKIWAAEQDRLKNGGQGVEMIDVMGGDHIFPLISSIGVVQQMLKPKERRRTILHQRELDSSAAEWILHNMGFSFGR